ncbi:MAG: hypothetical protein AAF790_14300, partial [Planctomycetota bacterium]
MQQLDLLRLVVQTLERLGIEYAIVGSFASGAWGEPRFTEDIDIVVRCDIFDAQSLCDAFPQEDFYVSKTAAAEAVESHGQFNLIHPATCNKVDFMLVGSTEWNDAQLQRRRAAPIFPDLHAYIASPEDVILGKLLYYRDGGSEKHIRDITGVLTTGAVELDRAYLDHHARGLGVEEEWRSILTKLGLPLPAPPP